ncbi:MAG: 30S ribosome-binding factor RbfA [Bythopirellula sp.]|nr:30S ribosome-binding factor RbfA [Bythopirellula sp.]
MTSRRVLKAAEAIREVVSMAILTDLRDPRIQGVTVTFVEVSPDMRVAKVHVSIMGSDTAQKLCLKGLQSSAGFLQLKIAKRIDTRYTPVIRFELDMGVKKSIAIAKMLTDMLPEEEAAVAEDDENFDHSEFDDIADEWTETEDDEDDSSSADDDNSR